MQRSKTDYETVPVRDDVSPPRRGWRDPGTVQRVGMVVAGALTGVFGTILAFSEIAKESVRSAQSGTGCQTTYEGSEDLFRPSGDALNVTTTNTSSYLVGEGASDSAVWINLMGRENNFNRTEKGILASIASEELPSAHLENIPRVRRFLGKNVLRAQLGASFIDYILRKAVCNYKTVPECLEYPNRGYLSPDTCQRIAQFLFREAIREDAGERPRFISNVSKTGYLAFIIQAAEAELPGQEKLYDAKLKKEWVDYVAEKVGLLSLGLETAFKEHFCPHLLTSHLESYSRIDSPVTRAKQARNILDRLELPPECQPKAVMDNVSPSFAESDRLNSRSWELLLLFDAQPAPGTTVGLPPPPPLTPEGRELAKIADGLRVITSRFGCTPEDDALCRSTRDRPLITTKQWRRIIHGLRKWDLEFIQGFGALNDEITALTKAMPNFRKPKSPDGLQWADRVNVILQLFRLSVDEALLPFECYKDEDPQFMEDLEDLRLRHWMEQRRKVEQLYKCRKDYKTTHWLRRLPDAWDLNAAAENYVAPRWWSRPSTTLTTATATTEDQDIN